MTLKVMVAASHIALSNGYSRVMYALANHLAYKKDIELIYFGFQNFNPNPEHVKQRLLPKNVYVYDAWAGEGETKQMGFGFDQVAGFVDEHKPDIVIVYNDFVVVSNILEKIKTCKHRDFKTIIYIDQVYLSQKKEYIKRLNDDADFVITFTPYWDKIIKDQGMTKPSDWLQHGFDPMKNFPIPKKLARLHFSLKPDDIIFINMNRNQNRKRLDLTMVAWAEFISRHRGEPVKLLIGTHPTQGSWHLIEIYERELRLRDITLEEGMKHIILIDNPQQLTDEDVNILYNCADVGINTTMGAGFELTNFEHGGMGYPQVAPYIGGLRDFLDGSVAKVIHPKIPFYTDHSFDGCPGCAELCDPMDFVEAFESYYADEDLRKEHGKKCRERILKNYKWDDLGEKFYNIIKKVSGVKDDPVDIDKISLDDIANLEKNLNINEIKTKIEVVEDLGDEVVSVPVVAKSHEDRKDNIKNRLKKKLDEKKKKIEISELIKLKKQLDKLK